MTEEMKGNAKREADLIQKEAELKAERLLEQAHRKLAHVQAEIAEMVRQRELFLAKLRGLIKSHLEWLEAQPEKAAPAAQSRQAGGTPAETQGASPG
jgi:cell division initiation protein